MRSIRTVNVKPLNLSKRCFYTSPINQFKIKKQQQEDKSEDNEQFNKELSQDDYDLNRKNLEEFERGENGSVDGVRKHVDDARGKYKTLEEKGESIATEQDRPEDFM